MRQRLRKIDKSVWTRLRVSAVQGLVQCWRKTSKRAKLHQFPVNARLVETLTLQQCCASNTNRGKTAASTGGGFKWTPAAAVQLSHLRLAPAQTAGNLSMLGYLLFFFIFSKLYLHLERTSWEQKERDLLICCWCQQSSRNSPDFFFLSEGIKLVFKEPSSYWNENSTNKWFSWINDNAFVLIKNTLKTKGFQNNQKALD